LDAVYSHSSPSYLSLRTLRIWVYLSFEFTDQVLIRTRNR
jgi:hypothetical protein